jgi:hypothetical protein
MEAHHMTTFIVAMLMAMTILLVLSIASRWLEGL